MLPLLRNLAFLALLATSTGAQETVGLPPTDRETIRQLAQQVKQLQEKVAALEKNQGSSPAAVPDVTAPATIGDVSTATPEQTTAFEDSHEVRGIRWRGFGEVNYKVLNQRQPELGTFGFVPGSSGNFFTGDFDLFLTSKLTDKTSVLAEVVIGEGDAQTFHTELARALLK